MYCGNDSRGNRGDMADEKLRANNRIAGKKIICLPTGPILSTTKLSLCKSQLDFEAVSTSESWWYKKFTGASLQLNSSHKRNHATIWLAEWMLPYHVGFWTSPRALQKPQTRGKKFLPDSIHLLSASSSLKAIECAGRPHRHWNTCCQIAPWETLNIINMKGLIETTWSIWQNREDKVEITSKRQFSLMQILL